MPGFNNALSPIGWQAKLERYLSLILMDFLSEPWFWIAVTAASEIIGMSKLKDNSVIQLAFHALESLKPKKKV